MDLDKLLREYEAEIISNQDKTIEEKIKHADYGKLYYLYNILKRSDYFLDFLNHQNFDDLVVFATALQKNGMIKEVYNYRPDYRLYSKNPPSWWSLPIHRVLDKMGDLGILRRPTEKEMKMCLEKCIKIIPEDSIYESEGLVNIFISPPRYLDNKDIIEDFCLGVGNDVIIESEDVHLILFYNSIDNVWTDVLDGLPLEDLHNIQLRPGFYIDLKFYDEDGGIEYLDILIPRWVDPVTKKMIF